MLIQWLRPLYEEDDEGSSGSEGGKVRASELRAQLGQTPDEGALMRLLEKHADVLNDNAALRAQRRTLRQEVTTLKERQPAEGARVLSAEESPLWDAYRALGEPDAVKKALDASSGAGAELQALKRERALAMAADAVGYKASVLTTLAGDLDIQMKQGKDGKPIAVVVEGEKETPLTDYAAQAWADFLPALAAKSGPPTAPDINAGARGNGKAPGLTDEERERATARYRLTF